MTKRDSELRTLWISRIDYHVNSGVEPHLHQDFFQLILVMDGYGTLIVDNETYFIEPKHCYFIPKGSLHSFKFSKEATTIDFKFSINCNELAQFVSKSNISVPISDEDLYNHLKEVFQLSCDNFRVPDKILPYQIDVSFKSFLLSFVRSQEIHNSKTHSRAVAFQEIDPNLPIVNYMIEHIECQISLENIANHFNFHPHYLIELFRKKLGTTPMQFLQKLRIEKSKEYLEFTNYTITEVAELVGLSAPYFSRLFREREGNSPTQYREQTTNVIGKDIILEEDFLTYLEQQPPVSIEKNSRG